MNINGFGQIDGDKLYAEYSISTNDNRRCVLINLYDRIGFIDDLATKKYICIYKDSPSLVPQDTVDKTADVIFERTINPDLDPRIYVCIKVGDKMRENLKGLTK